MSQLYPVPFHGDTVYCVEHNGEPYTPMRPIIDNLGISWGNQATKLNSNKDRWGVLIIRTPSSGGEQQTLCIPVRKLPAFLASINARKVRPELHDKLIRYQNECDDALWNYWTGNLKDREAGPVQGTASLPALQGAAWTMDVQDALRAALAKLEFAASVQGMGVGCARLKGKEEHIRHLFLACVSDVNAAAATVRALIALGSQGKR